MCPNPRDIHGNKTVGIRTTNYAQPLQNPMGKNQYPVGDVTNHAPNFLFFKIYTFLDKSKVNTPSS